MDLREKITEGFERRKGDILVFVLLLGFGFFINRGVELKGLYMDDLYLWSCYGEQSFREFVFPMGGTRFRFIFYLAAWLELLFLGGHVSLTVPFNIILNSLIAFSIYRISVRFSKGRHVIGVSLAAAYLLSRMSYYQISQFYGLMESLGLWAAVGILYFLYRYVNEKSTLDYVMANLLYFTVSFIHERYMVLFPVLLLGLTAAGRSRSEGSRSGKSRRRDTQGAQSQNTPVWRLLLLNIGTVVLIQVIRLATIGTLSPAGTGGTDVADTFHFMDAVGHAWEQVGYVFGRNMGPDYLCGVPYRESPKMIRMFILAANGVIGVSVLLFVIALLRDRENCVMHLKNLAIFLVFIILNIGSSSVTIRVEMRWVYVVYAAALLMFSYMASIMGKAGVLVLMYILLLFPTEMYYRNNWDKLYYWPNQLRYNSLAEETYGRYGDEIFDKQVYIIGNRYGLSKFTAETFLKVYDRKKQGANTTISFIDSDFDLKEIRDDMVILREDPDHNAYQDVTDLLKDQRMNLVYGSYSDGWIDENARIIYRNGDKNGIVLSFYYPGEITGNEVCRIRVNGKRMGDLVFTDNSMKYEIDAAPYQTISLEFSCNFHVKDAKEQRGEERLAMIVGMEPKN